MYNSDILDLYGRVGLGTKVVGCPDLRPPGGSMTKLQSALSKLIIGATLAAIASPASAWWQFVANGPNAERQVSQHYSSEKECKIALKATNCGWRKDIRTSSLWLVAANNTLNDARLHARRLRVSTVAVLTPRFENNQGLAATSPIAAATFSVR